VAGAADGGIEKSAMLLLALGPDAASEVLKHLAPREVQKLGQAMAEIRAVPHERAAELFDALADRHAQGNALPIEEDTIRAMLTKALGDDRAAPLLGRILHGGESAGIDSLKWMDAATIAELIQREHPQIVATILVHLDPDQAGAVARLLPEPLRNDVMLRIATLDGVQPAALHELNEALARLLAGAAGSVQKTALGGIRQAAEILNYVGQAAETAVLDNVRESDPELAQKLLDEMFIFENLLEVDDRGIQLLLREIQSDSLIVALKGASPELREKIFKNMSQRAAEMLKEDLESKGPVRLSEVEAEQKEIIKIARRLADEGQIQLGGKGADDQMI